jgi:hypothetical protein
MIRVLYEVDRVMKEMTGSMCEVDRIMRKMTRLLRQMTRVKNEVTSFMDRGEPTSRGDEPIH